MTELTAETKRLLDEVDVEEASTQEEVVTPPKHNPRRLGTGGCATSPQSYENSSMSASEKEADYFESEDALFNDRTPNLALKSESPIHRLMIYLKSTGLSNKEIGERLNKSPSWISQVLRQPWARQRLVEEIRIAGRDTLQGILAGQAEDSVWTLVEVRDNPTAKNSDKINASNSLLDRLLGRPNQPHTHSGKVDPTKVSDEDLVKVIYQGEHASVQT